MDKLFLKKLGDVAGARLDEVDELEEDLALGFLAGGFEGVDPKLAEEGAWWSGTRILQKRGRCLILATT